MIAVVEAYRAHLFDRSQWIRNAVAGVIVGVVALPLAMAFAIASGARPEQGLYTAIIGGLVVTLLGGTRLQIAGPTGAFVAVLSGITAKYGIDGLQVATFMAGCILVLMGIAKLGAVIRFIPAPVIVGFTSGIGVIIFVGQWRDFLGLPKVDGDHFHTRVLHLIEAMPELHWQTAALAAVSLALVIFAPRFKPLAKIPGPLVAMVVATAITTIVDLPGIATIGSAFGGIPEGLPSFHLPTSSVSQVLTLLGPAFTIAMLGSIESLLSAVVADAMANTKHESNQELIGQGLANLVAPLFGGFAATGAIARTATSIRNGATGPIAGIVHAVTLIAVLLLLAPLASHIPLPALAAILFVVAWNMSDVRHFVGILRRAPVADRVILVVTFLLTVFADLVVAVNVGVLLAVLQFLRRMSESVETREVDTQELAVDLAAAGAPSLPSDVVVYEIAGPLFFGAAETFEHALRATHTVPRILILRLGRVPFMDITGIQALEAVIRDLRKRGVTVLLCEANDRVLTKLRVAGVVAPDDPGHSASLAEALRNAGIGDTVQRTAASAPSMP